MIPTETRFFDFDQIIETDPYDQKKLILNCLNSAIESVQPENLMGNKLSLQNNDELVVASVNQSFPLKSFDKVLVVGAGKAGVAMAEIFEQMVPVEVKLSGTVIVPEGTTRRQQTKRIVLLSGTHPIPSEENLTAAAAVLDTVRSATNNSLVVCLISGGGSSLMTLPLPELTLEDVVETTHLLLKRGAKIEELNCVRKHLSAVTGGQLAKAANGARVLSLIISDIIGNPIGSIASGPTAPDPTTFADAIQIVEDYRVIEKLTERVFRILKQGAAGIVPETPKPNDPIFDRVSNVILGDNSVACLAVIDEIRIDGRYDPFYLGSSWQGEARETSANLVGLISAIRQNLAGGPRFNNPVALVWGGETTVTVEGKGKGGRNQEEALSALIKLNETPGISMAFMGTDGIDGFSKAAGAIVDSTSYQKSISKKIDPKVYLADNDSSTFFEKVGGMLLVTGPTGTNVNDIGIALIYPDKQRNLLQKKGEL
jgi:glycerate 2-kinase